MPRRRSTTGSRTCSSRRASRPSDRRATLKTEVLQTIGRTLDFAGHYGANLDALYDALVDMGDASQNGIVILLDRIPVGPGFDADARESLLETFRDAADTLAESDKRFRVFYSFA